MNLETDLESVKRIAKGLLNVSILETDYSPMIVSHPFTKSGIICMLDEHNFVQLDITKSQKAFKKWTMQMSKQIDEARDVYQIYHLLNESYRLLFFDDVAQFLSRDDFSNLLGDVWVTSEYANLDANVSKKKMLTHFKKSDKMVLMSESELETYNELEDWVIIYRGVTEKYKNNIKALSWTLSFGKAKWFAERYGTRGFIYSAQINKQDILAYFDRKDEEEVIIDYNKLLNVKAVDRPLPKSQKGMPGLE